MGSRDGRGGDTHLPTQRGRGLTALKLGVFALAALAAAYFLGADPRVLLGLVDAPPPPGAPIAAPQAPAAAPTGEVSDFISVVLADTEDTWTQIFAEEGETYIPPRLRYFEGSTRSGCSQPTGAEIGPFYCAPDRRVYIDLNFYRELAERFKTPDGLAQAYVIAHEVGHHVQNLLGTETKLRKAQAGKNLMQRNALQLRLELQADCYAGIWAHNTERNRHLLEADGLEDALVAAAAVGQDMSSQAATDEVMHDTFLHGTATQRQRWFQAGMKRGQTKDCDTFSARRL